MTSSRTSSTTSSPTSAKTHSRDSKPKTSAGKREILLVPHTGRSANLEMAAEAAELNRQMVREQTVSLKTEMENAGVTFNEVDTALFIEATQPVYEKWRAQFPELMDEVVAAAQAASQ